MNPELITVAELLSRDPGAARILELHRIDYCCGGGRTVAEACLHAGIEPAILFAELAKAKTPPAKSGVQSWEQRPLEEVVAHLITSCHAPLKEALPRLRAMVDKVAAVHGAKQPQFHDLARCFQPFAEGLAAHLTKEERVLFPWLLSEHSAGAADPIGMMRCEHAQQVQDLKLMRSLCDGYLAPTHACGTWRGLYAGLQTLEQQVQEHIRLEDEILFPRALARA